MPESNFALGQCSAFYSAGCASFTTFFFSFVVEWTVLLKFYSPVVEWTYKKLNHDRFEGCF